jgi:hypothetical protein
MLLLTLLLAVAPVPATGVQVTDNPFAEGARPRRATRRRTTRQPASRRRTSGRSSGGGGSVYYANCSAARAAGAAPVMRGEAGYSSKLDRDNDGVGCE